MRRSFFLALLFVLPCMTVLAQEESPEDLYDDAEYFFVREEYAEAAYLFSQILKAEPENANVMFMLGSSYLKIPGQEYKAIPYFEKACSYISYNHKKNRYSEKMAPAHVWFYLGDAYRVDNQLDKAIEAYTTFTKTKNFEKNYNQRMVDEAIKSAERAKIIQDAPLNLYAYCLEEPINSGNSDYDGVISANEKVMVWINSQKFYEALMMSVKQDGKWSTPVNITPQVGSDGDLIPTGLSADGKELYLIRQSPIDNDIYYSHFDGSLWSVALPLPGEANSNFNEDFASVSADGKVLYIASDRPGSEGGLDIFVAEKQENGEWGSAVPMVGPVNTEEDETAPYMSPDGSRFYFSSKGHFNMGGYDIFYCKVNEDNTLSLPTNIGFPINTTSDNTWFIPVKDGLTALYSRYTNEGVGKEDLWMLEIVPLKNMIAKALTRLSEENFTIELTDEKGEKITLYYDAVKDIVTVESESGTKYKVVYSREE